jgi:hypothetical protein
LFPAFTDHSVDVNHILYYAGKVNQPNGTFIEDVLNYEDIITAQENKESFDQILKEVIGEEVDTR